MSTVNKNSSYSPVGLSGCVFAENAVKPQSVNLHNPSLLPGQFRHKLLRYFCVASGQRLRALLQLLMVLYKCFASALLPVTCDWTKEQLKR